MNRELLAKIRGMQGQNIFNNIYTRKMYKLYYMDNNMFEKLITISLLMALRNPRFTIGPCVLKTKCSLNNTGLNTSLQWNEY